MRKPNERVKNSELLYDKKTGVCVLRTDYLRNAYSLPPPP